MASASQPSFRATDTHLSSTRACEAGPDFAPYRPGTGKGHVSGWGEPVKHTAMVLAALFSSSIGWAVAPSLTPAPSEFERIDTLLKSDKSIDSVAKLLEQLPNKKLFDDYVLMRETKSNQEATDQEPRVILFGGSGDLVLAYDRSGKSVEAMEFDRNTNTWNFFDVRFSNEGPKILKNPTACNGCHTSARRPNWAPYPTWPGAYGENESLKPEEKEKYEAFVGKAKNNPLYKHLPGLDGHYVRGRGADPNTRFTASLAARNFLRIAEQIRQLPAYPELRYALAAANIPGCFTVDEERKVSLPFLPEGEFRKVVEALASAKLQDREKTYQQRTGMTMDVIRALVETVGEVDSVQKWSMLFSPKEFIERAPKAHISTDIFTTGTGGAERLLSQGLVQVDPTLAKILKPYMVPYFSKVPPDDHENAAEKRARELSQPLFDLPRVSRRGEKKACATLTQASLDALKKFQWKPPRKIADRREARTHGKN